jgi:hypothetical protein
MGNENSGNPYSFNVNPETEIGIFIDQLASKKGQAKGMYILWLVLTANLEQAKDFWKADPDRLAQLTAKYGSSYVQFHKDKQDTK